MSATPSLHWSEIYPGWPASALYGHAGEYPTELDDGRAYRYALSRCWRENSHPEVWLMCNPSTATATRDDATIRRVKRYSHDWGAGGFVVMNMLAYRSTDPYGLDGCDDAIGTWNDAAIRAAIELASLGSRRIVCAWGAVFAAHFSAWRERARAIESVAAAFGVALVGLATSADGHPRHPLRLGAELRPHPWSTALTS